MTGRQTELCIAEIPYETGELRWRYSRYLADDGSGWVRHGLSVQYYRNGQVAAQGEYVDGQESGKWRTYHENGQLASEGFYRAGKETGRWRFWDSRGEEEEGEEFG